MNIYIDVSRLIAHKLLVVVGNLLHHRRRLIAGNGITFHRQFIYEASEFLKTLRFCDMNNGRSIPLVIP